MAAVPNRLSFVEQREVLGVEAPIMARDALIEYKKLAGRETDLFDVRELEQSYKTGKDGTS